VREKEVHACSTQQSSAPAVTMAEGQSEEQEETTEDEISRGLNSVDLGEADEGDYAPQTQEQQQMVREALQQLGGQSSNLQNAMTSALQKQLNSLVGQSSGFLESLSLEVQDRIGELRRLQDERDKLHSAFLREKHELERKYEAKERPLYEQRARIVSGDEDVDHPNVGSKSELEEGVPDFWLCVLRNCEETGDSITERDEDALKYLTDISANQLTGENENGFALHFSFKQPNPYFSNDVLSKTYYMADHEDPVMDHAEATPINWHSGKDLTVKVMRKKAKSKSGRTMVKREKAESFFNFFKPPEIPESAENLSEEQLNELQNEVEQDYELGCVIRDKIVPDALRWFTGEAVTAESDEEEGEDEDEDEDDEDEDEDEDEDDTGDEENENGRPADSSQQQCSQQ
jgi:nucleosome assembly protein 1-like 1